MEKTLDKLTKEQAERLVEEDKAKFIEVKDELNKYLIYQNKLYLRRLDGYFPHQQHYDGGN